MVKKSELREQIARLQEKLVWLDEDYNGQMFDLVKQAAAAKAALDERTKELEYQQQINRELIEGADRSRSKIELLGSEVGELRDWGRRGWDRAEENLTTSQEARAHANHLELALKGERDELADESRERKLAVARAARLEDENADLYMQISDLIAKVAVLEGELESAREDLAKRYWAQPSLFENTEDGSNVRHIEIGDVPPRRYGKTISSSSTSTAGLPGAVQINGGPSITYGPKVTLVENPDLDNHTYNAVESYTEGYVRQKLAESEKGLTDVAVEGEAL